MRLFKWIVSLVLIGLAYPGCANPNEDFIIELLRPYEWEMLQAGVAHYEKFNPGTFQKMGEVNSANEFYRKIEEILDYPDSGQKKKVLESLNALAENRTNRVYSVVGDKKIHSLNYHASTLYPSIFGNEDAIKAKFAVILKKAKNDPYICYLEGKDFMSKFTKKMDKLSGEEWKKEEVMVNRLIQAMKEKETIQAKVKELKAIYAAKAKMSVKNWANLNGLIKKWNEENREFGMANVAFPIFDKQCLKVYHQIVEGENRYQEEACWKNIGEKPQAEIKALASLYLSYSESSFEDSLMFKNAFNNQLNLFRGQLSPEQFYEQPIVESTLDWLKENFLLLLSGLFFLFGFILLFLKIIKPRLASNKPSNHPPASSSETGTTDIEVLNPKKDKEILDLKNENKNLRQELENMSRRIVLLENQQARDGFGQGEESRRNANSHPPVEPPPPATPSSYALRPDGDRGFLTSSISTDADNNLYYELKLKEDGTGTYRLVEDQSLQLSAAKSANVILEPACEYENMPFEINDSIVTIRQGTLKNDGHQWTILDKAKIKFV